MPDRCRDELGRTAHCHPVGASSRRSATQSETRLTMRSHALAGEMTWQDVEERAWGLGLHEEEASGEDGLEARAPTRRRRASEDLLPNLL